MPASQQTLEQHILGASGQGLGVTFEWHDDRFLHTLAFINTQGQWHPLLTLAAEEQPRLPLSQMVTQEVHLQDATDEQPALAFLTGAAARDYWSGSIAAPIDSQTGSPCLDLDIVCRQRGDLHPLELNYAVAPGVSCEWDSQRLSLRPLETGPTDAEPTETGPTIHVVTLDSAPLAFDQQQLAISVAVPANAAAPYVARCQYQVYLDGENC